MKKVMRRHRSKMIRGLSTALSVLLVTSILPIPGLSSFSGAYANSAEDCLTAGDTTTVTGAVYPGGVQGVALWLKASDRVEVAEGTKNVTSWTDANGIQFSTDSIRNGIILDESLANFNPTIRFNRNGKMVGDANSSMKVQEIFTIAKHDGSSAVFSTEPLGGQQPQDFFADDGNQTFSIYNNTSDLNTTHQLNGPRSRFGDKLRLLASSPQQQTAWENGVGTKNGQFTDAGIKRPLKLGENSAGAHQLTGHFSELVVFNDTKTLTAGEMNRINSYLTFKYGVTLKADNNTSADYVASDGTTKMWTAVDNEGYGNRITGIGRDDASALKQKQSKSAGVDANVTIAIGNDIAASNKENACVIANDKSFFTFSDNGSGAAAYTTVIGNTYLPDGLKHMNSDTKTTEMMNRVFKVDKSPNWVDGPITLQVDGPFKNTPYLFISNAPDFPANSTMVEAMDKVTGKVTLPSSLLSDASYFTVVMHVDKKALETRYNEVKNLDPSLYYTADSSWQAYQQELNNARNILTDASKTETEVNNALVALNAAIAGLKRVPVLESVVLKQTVAEGNKVILTFDQEMTLTDLSGFTILVDGTPITIGTVDFKADPTDAKNVILTLPSGTDVKGKAVTITYDGSGSLKGKNGAPAASFANRKAEDPFTAALTITTPTSGAKVNVKRPAMNGKAEAGSSVTVAVYGESGNLITGAGGFATIDGSGNWTFTPLVDLPDGKYQIQVTATKDGNTATKERLFEVNTPVAVKIDQPSGNTVTKTKPEFKGTTDAGATVTVEIKDKNGNVIGRPTVQVNADGSWSFTPDKDLIDGTYTIEVTATKDGKSTQVTKTVTMATTNDSTLAGLQLNSWNGTPIGLSPAFNGGTTKYTASVTNSVYSVTVSSLPLDPSAKIEVSVNNGPWQQVASGTTSGNLPLNVGTNTIVVKVTDAKGHVTEYTLTITRESSDSGDSDSSSGGSTTTPSTSTGSSSSGGSTTPNGSGIETSVNGKDDTFATGKESTSGDRKVTSVQVDLDKLNKAVSQGNGQKLAIHSSKDGDMKVDGLTAGAVKQLADKGAGLEISNPLAIYPIPGGKMDLSAVSKQLGNAALGDIAVHIDIARSSDTLITNAKNKAAAEGYELLVTPVDLDMTFSHDGKMVRAGQLNGYAAKYIALPEGIDPNRITTGVIVNPDGSVFHVPTVVTKINSRYYALIKDLRSNGSYSVIWNPQDFDDVKSHWGKADVNNIAARLELAGTGNNTFSPDRNVTRSEFSEIVVAGLGLKRQNAPQNKFPDVSDSAWYRSSVAIANEFDIVRGYEDGNFYGDRQITREQGMAMIARAYKLIEMKAALSQEQTDALLAKYEDAKKVSAWAREDIALMIEAGIVQGNGPQLLSPQSNMTRAEVTALIARLLKTTNLIDK